MIDQLINIKTAKLAKECGFDEETFWFFDLTINSETIRFEPNYYNSGFKDKISAPTQSLLQKWLRKKHKIHVTPRLKVFPNHYSVVIDEYGKFTNELSTNTDTMAWHSYEEALEVGLYEALKLIK